MTHHHRATFAVVVAVFSGTGCATVYSARVLQTSPSGARLVGEVAHITLAGEDSVIIAFPVFPPEGAEGIAGCFALEEEGYPEESQRTDPDAGPMVSDSAVVRRRREAAVRAQAADSIPPRAEADPVVAPQVSQPRVPDFVNQVLWAQATPRGRSALTIKTTEDGLAALGSLRLDVFPTLSQLPGTGCPAPREGSQRFRFALESTEQGRSMAVGGVAAVLLIAIGAGVSW